MLVREHRVTVALIEHNFSFVAEVANRAYVLRAGVVHDQGSADEVLSKDENREILIGL
jgi:ABC-type branched-subunit amino acid transport system ATPase component